jgi:hypothetical protein
MAGSAGREATGGQGTRIVHRRLARKRREGAQC